MKSFFLNLATGLMCLGAMCSCGDDSDIVIANSDQFVTVNGVRYTTAATTLSTNSGLRFEATTVDEEVSINLVMSDAELNKEYDLNVNGEGGNKYLQVIFSKSDLDSYSVAMMGPYTLNVLKGWGGSEKRDLKDARAKIARNDNGTYSVYITAEGDGLTFMMDFNGEIDQVK